MQLRTGEFEEAERLARRAFVFMGSRVDHRVELGNAQLVLGRALLEQGKVDEADETFCQAERTLDSRRDRGARVGVARAGRVRDAQGRHDHRRRPVPARRRSTSGLSLLERKGNHLQIKLTSVLLLALAVASVLGKAKFGLLGFFQG